VDHQHHCQPHQHQHQHFSPAQDQALRLTLRYLVHISLSLPSHAWQVRA
jgi:hypothetical protein